MPAVKVTVTCNKGNNAQTIVDFKFFFDFKSVFVLSFFVVLDMLLLFALFGFVILSFFFKRLIWWLWKEYWRSPLGKGDGGGSVGSAACLLLPVAEWKAGRRELLCGERAEEEGAADRSGSVGDAATDGEDRLGGEGLLWCSTMRGEAGVECI